MLLHASDTYSLIEQLANIGMKRYEFDAVYPGSYFV